MRNFLILMGLLLCPSLTWAASAGQVESANGDVWVMRGQQSFTLASGSAVQTNDIIRTGKTGQVRLVMSDDSVVVLGPKSRLRIDHYDMNKKGLVTGAFYLLWGKARFLVTKLKQATSSFTVSTQTGNIGVRGTEFGVIVSPPGQGLYTDVMLFKGAVVGHDLHGAMVVMKPGQFVHFTENEAPQERNFSQEDVKRLGIRQLAPGIVEPQPLQLPAKPANPGANAQPHVPGGMANPNVPPQPTQPPRPAHPAHPAHPAKPTTPAPAGP